MTVTNERELKQIGKLDFLFNGMIETNMHRRETCVHESGLCCYNALNVAVVPIESILAELISIIHV